jgi:hypothetical protein
MCNYANLCEQSNKTTQPFFVNVSASFSGLNLQLSVETAKRRKNCRKSTILKRLAQIGARLKKQTFVPTEKFAPSQL